MNKKSKGVALKKAKLPHITKQFKHAVERALEPSMIRQSFHATFTGGYNRMNNSIDTQAVFSSTNGQDGMGYFSASHFLDAVSRLFNGKVTALNLGGINTGAAGSYFATAYTPLKFKVRNSWSTLDYKNNTLRTLKLKIYECAPKAKGGGSFNNLYQSRGLVIVDPVTGATSFLAAQDAVVEPVTGWAFNLLDDFIDGYSSTVNAIPAKAAIPQSTLGLVPGSSKNFARTWKTDLKEFILLPGESCRYYIQGPSDLELDYEKYIFDGTYQDVQKWTRFIMNVCENDLVSTTLSGGGRYPTTLPTEGLVWERNDHYVLEMPEQAGVANRHDGYIKIVQQPTVAGAGNVVEYEAPVAVLTQ